MPTRSRTTGTCECRRWRGKQDRADPLSDRALPSQGRAFAGIVDAHRTAGCVHAMLPELKRGRTP